MTAADGKRRLTYVADTEQFLRIVNPLFPRQKQNRSEPG